MDTIPYFLDGVALGDRIRFDDSLEQAAFLERIHGGGHSGFRIIVMGHADKSQILASLTDLGAEYDQSPWPALLGVDVGPKVPLEPIVDLLDGLAGSGDIGYEVALIQNA